MSEAGRETVERLVEQFAQGKAYYTSAKYNETDLRVQFVNPLFEALSWDVRNTTGRFEVSSEIVWGQAKQM